MKKILLGLSAFIMMFAASCEQQEWTPNLGNEATVSFNVATPQIAVKAYSDGTTATKLQYAVYDAAGGILPNLTKTDAEINGSTTVELDLAAGDTYKVVFWAAADSAPYDVDFENKIMTVDYTNAKSNAENRDAFYACEEFTVSGPMSVDVVLKRPFAQLNIGANDFEAMANAGREIKLSKVVVPAYNTLNLLNGTVEEGDPTKKTFDYAAIPVDTEEFPVTGYKYMAMNYILVGADQELVDVEFHFATEGEAYTNSRTVGSVPVQRNHRTNIYGKVLTTGVDVNVEIKPGYDEEDNLYVLVDSREAAQAALDNAKKGTIIALQPNVNYGTLVFRQNSLSKVVDITTAGGDVPGNEKYRRIEDLTIIGAEGAVVDGFDFQVGWIDGSGASYIDVKNFTVEGVTFRGNKTPFNFEGAKGSALGIEGLNIVGCKMTDTEGKYRFVFQQISGYKELNDKTTNEYVMTSGIKNLTITKCEVTGAYMVIESRAMENLTITENIFRGIKARDMLITSDVTNHADKTYTGYINIAKNTSIEGEERFVRASLNNSDAVVVIRDNTIVDYKGEDPDFIKVDGGNNVTIENNILYPTYTVATVDELKSVLANAEDNITVKLAGVDFGGVDLYNSTNNGHRYNYANYEAKNVKIVGEDGASFSGLRLGENDYQPTMTGWTFENITFTGNGLQISMNNENVLVKNCKFINSELMNTGTDAYQAKNFMVQGCSFEGSRPDNRKTQMSLQNNNGVKILGCSFTNSDYSAINMTKIYGNVEIADNTINQTADRPLRFVLAANEATLKITGNTIVSNGDENGELMKVTADSGIVIAESNITLSGNTWNGKSDAEIERILDANVYIVK